MKYIKEFLKYCLFVGGLLFWFFVVVGYIQPHETVYDCRLAEISPDFPIEVRNECRKLRSVKPIST